MIQEKKCSNSKLLRWKNTEHRKKRFHTGSGLVVSVYILAAPAQTFISRSWTTRIPPIIERCVQISGKALHPWRDWHSIWCNTDQMPPTYGAITPIVQCFCSGQGWVSSKGVSCKHPLCQPKHISKVAVPQTLMKHHLKEETRWQGSKMQRLGLRKCFLQHTMFSSSSPITSEELLWGFTGGIG